MTIRNGLLLAVFFALALACRALTLPVLPTAAPTSRADPNLLHFEDQWVAFDFPKGFDVYEGADPAFTYPGFKWTPVLVLPGEQVAAIGDPDFRANNEYLHSILVTHRGLTAGEDVEQSMQDFYQMSVDQYHAVEGLLALPQTITVDSVRAYQETYRIFWGEPAYDLRDVWVPEDDALYIVSIFARWSNLDDLAEFNAVADGVLRSLVIK